MRGMRLPSLLYVGKEIQEGRFVLRRGSISSTIRRCGWSPSFCGRRQEGINATGMNANLEGLSSVSLRLTAPSAEGAFWREPEQSLP